MKKKSYLCDEIVRKAPFVGIRFRNYAIGQSGDSAQVETTLCRWRLFLHSAKG